MIEMPVKMTMLVRRFYEEIINNAEFDKLDEILDPKIIWHDPLLPAGEVRGIENFKNMKCFVQLFRTCTLLLKIRFRKTNKWILVLPYGARIEET